MLLTWKAVCIQWTSVRSNVHRFTYKTVDLSLLNIYPARFNWAKADKTVQAWKPLIVIHKEDYAHAILLEKLPVCKGTQLQLSVLQIWLFNSLLTYRNNASVSALGKVVRTILAHAHQYSAQFHRSNLSSKLIQLVSGLVSKTSSACQATKSARAIYALVKLEQDLFLDLPCWQVSRRYPLEQLLNSCPSTVCNWHKPKSQAIRQAVYVWCVCVYIDVKLRKF